MRVAGADMDDQDRVDDEALEWFTRLSDPPVAAATRAEFAQWRLADPRHARAFDELALLWSGLDDIGELNPPSARGARDAHRRPFALSGRRSVAVVASALLLALVVSISLPEGGFPALLAGVRTSHGEVRKVSLADGSSIVMDAGTALSIEITADRRSVHLVAGRAFFEVRHDVARPFVVDAGDAHITDVGTAFEVSRLTSSARVAVAEGVVDISRSGGGLMRLGAGDALDLVSGRLATEQVQIASWRDHRLVFEDKPLAVVVDELRRYLPGWVVLSAGERGAHRLTGSLDTHDPVAALDALAKMADLSVQRIGPVTLLRTR